MQARSGNSKTVIDFETSFGVVPTTKKGKFVPFNSNGLEWKQNQIDPATITGTRNQVKPAKGNIDVSGTITIPIDLNAMGYWLKGAFNTPTTTGSAAPFTHKYIVQSTQPSMVIEKQFPDIGQYLLYSGMKVNSFKMAFGGDGELTADLDFYGKNETVGTTAYDSAATTVVMDRLNNFQASIEENGVVVGNVASGDFTISFGLDNSQYVIGSNGTKGDIPEGIVKVEGSLKVLFENADYINKAKNDTKSSLKLKLTKDATHSLEFLFPEITYEATSPSVSGSAGVVLDLKFQGFHETDSNNSAVVVTLINEVEAY